MAILYLLVQVLFYMKLIEFHSFWNYVNNQISGSDFFFRGVKGLFFYKGFLYMTVGLIFWIFVDYKRGSLLAISIITLAVILAGSRGFIIIFCLLFALYYGLPLLLKLNLKVILMSLVGLVIVFHFFMNVELGDKKLSDGIRIQQIEEVLQRVDVISLFGGHGFGVGVPVRPVHMEIAFLEVFHKQGLLGLLMWGILFLFIYNQYKENCNFKSIRKAFF